MKKTIYYFSPLIIVPGILLMTTLLESIEILKPIAPFFLFAAFFMFSFVVGVLSPAKTRFDYAMAVIAPCSVLLSLIIALFLDEGCDGKPQFSLHHALNVEYYKTWLPIVLIMLVIILALSFKPVKNFVRSKLSFKIATR